MPTYPITNAEIAAGKPLTSWLLKRLRDNWAEDLTDPPLSQTVKLRPSAYRCTGTIKRTSGVILISDTNNVAEYTDLTIQTVAFSGTGKSCGTNLGARRVGSSVRVQRTTPLFASQDTISGNLFTNAWILIPTNDTWVNLWTWSTGATTPSLEAKAYVTGTQTLMELRWTGSFAGLSVAWYAIGQLYSQQYTTPTAP